MKKLVVLTGSGISAESGIDTFRGNGGLWGKYNVMDVASIEGWYKDEKVMLDFYNDMRQHVAKVQPNEAHKGLVLLEEKYDVSIITQNVDDLHERAGSKKVIHLHGELNKACSSKDKSCIIDITDKNLKIGDKAKDGSQLRPDIVWFGEAVPMMDAAIKEASKADIFVVIGTSLNVYPAAGLVNYVQKEAELYLIDPNDVKGDYSSQCTFIKEKAVNGVKKLLSQLLK